MYTQCPECGTVFRVTAPVLRAAQGQVRCGVCDASFDALRFLTDDVELDVNAASASRIAGAPGEGSPAAAPAPPDRPAPPAPPAPPAGPTAARDIGAATRNRPSADEERALSEIAAILARGAKPGATAGATAGPTAARGAGAPPAAAANADADADADEINILEPSDVEDIILDDGGEDIPDAALEFDLPAERWEQVFVRDRTAGEAVALDLDLAGEVPRAGSESFEAPDELVILEVAEDPLARTDEYQLPDFAAEFELEPAAERAPVSGPTPDEVTELEPAEVAELELEPRPQAAAPAEAAAATRPRPTPPVWTPVPVDDAAEAESPTGADAAAGPRRSRYPLAAAAAAASLVLVLLAQTVHYYREALAESPLAGPAVAALYARLGVPLEPRWNLAAYDVRQWGAQSEETAGVLRLRASIVNRATRAQPFPLLRVTLEDRFGAQVGRREFTPAEYLPGRTAPRELLGAGARADADLSLADPGNQAVGFELDVCLYRHGALVCGADAKTGGG